MRVFRLVLLVGFLSACSSIEVTQDHIAEYNYASLQTFSWKPNENNGYGIQQNDSLDKRLRSAIENNLLSRSYRLVDSYTPDFFVSYFVTIKSTAGGDNISPEQYRKERYDSAGKSGTMLTGDYAEGTLLIDVTIPLGNKLVWRGIGTQLIAKNLSEDKTNELINKTVAEILQRFPPR